MITSPRRLNSKKTVDGGATKRKVLEGEPVQREKLPSPTAFAEKYDSATSYDGKLASLCGETGFSAYLLNQRPNTTQARAFFSPYVLAHHNLFSPQIL